MVMYFKAESIGIESFTLIYFLSTIYFQIDFVLAIVDLYGHRFTFE